MKGGTKYATTTAKSETGPWAPQQPYILRGLEAAKGIFDQGPQQYYPGATVAPFDPSQTQSLDLQRSRALAGNPLTGAAQAEAGKTLAGDYLAQGNPYLDQVTQRVANQVIPQVSGRFTASGRYGSPAFGETLNRGIADAVAPYAFNAYESERGRMHGAASAAPALAASDYFDIGMLGQAGEQQQGQGQAELSDLVNRWNFDQQEPTNALMRYLDAISGNYGSQGNTSQTTPYEGQSPLGQGIGYLSSLAGIFGQLGGGPAAPPSGIAWNSPRAVPY